MKGKNRLHVENRRGWVIHSFFAVDCLAVPVCQAEKPGSETNSLPHKFAIRTVRCGKGHNALCRAIQIGHGIQSIPERRVDSALVASPDLAPAHTAIPDDQPEMLWTMALSEWEREAIQ